MSGTISQILNDQREFFKTIRTFYKVAMIDKTNNKDILLLIRDSLHLCLLGL